MATRSFEKNPNESDQSLTSSLITPVGTSRKPAPQRRGITVVAMSRKSAVAGSAAPWSAARANAYARLIKLCASVSPSKMILSAMRARSWNRSGALKPDLAYDQAISATYLSWLCSSFLAIEARHALWQRDRSRLAMPLLTRNLAISAQSGSHRGSIAEQLEILDVPQVSDVFQRARPQDRQRVRLQHPLQLRRSFCRRAVRGKGAPAVEGIGHGHAQRIMLPLVTQVCRQHSGRSLRFNEELLVLIPVPQAASKFHNGVQPRFLSPHGRSVAAEGEFDKFR
eukprot:755681-Prymnesium_polylepis.2